MTRNQAKTIQHIEAQLETQRFAASQAARPVVTNEEKAQDLAQRMLAAKENGDLDAARALATLLKPLLQYLP